MTPVAHTQLKMMSGYNILVIGSGAREHAIVRALDKSPKEKTIYCLASNMNPGIAEICNELTVGNINDPDFVLDYAQEISATLAIIGPENPLENGVADRLWGAGVKTVGPKKNLAQLESSKAFTRDLLQEYEIPGCPKYQIFDSLAGVAEFLEEMKENYVVKFDGLMGGKGVKVSGDHLHSHGEALAYCGELVNGGGKFVIEEKFVGQEFSLMSFCDGDNLKHMPVVQDHKRAFEGDRGPNTGGMGTYSNANHGLPFLNDDDISEAQAINTATARALKAKFGEGYKGFLYGGFMATANGVKLIEYNARLGDPEAMNVLSLLESDFINICIAIVEGALDQEEVRFANQATVCKYAVPKGYPENPVKGKAIDVSNVSNLNRLFYASVDIKEGQLIEVGSRTVAVVGAADTLSEAEAIAEKEISAVKGPLFHRSDIGTDRVVQQRIDHMNSLR